MFIFNFIVITREYFKENYRNILITAVGLVFIVSIFTISLISEEGLKIEFIESNLNDEQISFSVTKYNFDERFSQNKNGNITSQNYIPYREKQSSVSNITSIITDEAKKHEIDEYIIDTNHTSKKISLSVQVLQNSTILIDYTNLISIDDNFALNTLISSNKFSGRLPINESEVLLVKKIPYESYFDFGDSINYVLDMEINLTYYNYWDFGQTYDYLQYNHTVKIVGIYEPSFTRIDSQNKLTDDLLASNPLLDTGSFITSDFLSFDKITAELNTTEYDIIPGRQFEIDIGTKIIPQAFEQISNNFNNFFSDLSWNNEIYLEYYQEGNDNGIDYYSKGRFYEITAFDEIAVELQRTEFFSILLMLPALFITIFFSSYTANMFFDRRKSQIGILKVRGISKVQLFGVLFIEGILSTITALIVGFLLGIILASITLQSKYLFDFNLALNKITFSIGSFNAILLWTILITGTVIVSRAVNLSRINIIGARNPKANVPLWKRFYFDVIILIIGIIGNIVFYTVVFQPAFQYSTQSLDAIIILFFTPFPFLLLLGGSLTLSRIIAPVTKKFTKKMWSRSANIFTYSLTSMFRKKNYAAQTIMLCAVIFSLIWAMFTIPVVMETNIIRSQNYAVGADCHLNNPWNVTLEKNFATDPHIEDYTPIGKLSITQDKGNLINVFIVYPGFSEVAYLEDNFVSKNAIYQIIENNNTILVYEKSLEEINRNVGDDLTLTMTQQHNVNNYELKINGKFNYWPKLITKPTENNDHIDPYDVEYDDPNTGSQNQEEFINELFIVMSNNTFTEIYKTPYNSTVENVEKSYYLKTNRYTNNTLLREKYGYDELKFTDELIEKELNSLSCQVLWQQLNVLFIVNFSTIILSILIYGYNQVRSRARELSVERSLGMKLGQISRMFIYEIMAILGFSYVFGFILGALFSSIFSSLIITAILANPFPPALLFYPFTQINEIIIYLIVAGVIVSIVPAIIARRQDINKALKTY